MEAVELNSIDELYAFVESAAHRTGLILDVDAVYRPWARTVAADCRDMVWVYPRSPLSEQLLQHLSNFAHAPMPEKGFVLLERGRVVRAVDVAAVGGSSQPHQLAAVVAEAFEPKRKASSPPAATAACADPYAVLGASETDSDEELKHKYKQLLLQYHPDRVEHLGPELRELAERKTTEINTAFAIVRRQRGF